MNTLRWCFGAILFFATMVTASADEPRKINFLTAIVDQDGKTITECVKLSEDTSKCAETQDLTLGRLAVAALTRQYPADPTQLSGEDQVRRALLAQTIYKNGEAVLDTKDIDLLCTSIAKLVPRVGYSASVTLQAWQLLDPVRVKK
jgi:hypothetical protein